MQPDEDFNDLIGRLRRGDAEAAAELVGRYEKEVRRAIRIRLTDPRLRRTLDSLDICQSVLGNFFVRAAAGQFDLERPEQLAKLLVTMARNKLLDKVREQQADRRDGRRVEGDGGALAQVADPGDSPSQIVAGRELMEAARRLLSAEERYLADQRALERSWNDLAAERGSTAEALRKQLARAMDRVARLLGLDVVGGVE